MSTEPNTIGLTEERVKELFDLVSAFQSKNGFNDSDPIVRVGAYVGSYLDTLLLTATIENEPESKQLTQIQKRTDKLRRNIFTGLKHYLRRTPTAGEMVSNLSRFVTVPAYLSEVIEP